jgi:hypothetical protein
MFENERDAPKKHSELQPIKTIKEENYIKPIPVDKKDIEVHYEKPKIMYRPQSHGRGRAISPMLRTQISSLPNIKFESFGMVRKSHPYEQQLILPNIVCGSMILPTIDAPVKLTQLQERTALRQKYSMNNFNSSLFN